MNRKLTSCLVALKAAFFSGALLFAQSTNHHHDFDRYVPLQSQDPLPDFFGRTSTDKAREDAQQISHKESGSRRLAKKEKEFITISQFEIDRYLSSGKVIFNDPLSQYCNRIMKRVLGEESKANEVQVFIIRSSTVNAFATRQGYILMTIGMLAQLETEAQLAFLLCHEFIHYRNEHSLVTVRENEKISRRASNSRLRNAADTELEKSRFSRELESEADLEGLEIFLKSAYSRKAPDQLMDILKYSYLPFEEVPLQRSFLELTNLKLPDSRWLAEVLDIDAEEIETRDDEYSTHPNLRKRRRDIEAELSRKNEASNKGEDFLESEEIFNYVQKVARFELVRLNLLEKEFAEALYHVFLLMRSDSNSYFLHWAKSRALYGLSTYSNERKLMSVHTATKKVQGNSQAVYHLIYEMSREELTLFALKHVWDFRTRFPEDREANLLAESLVIQGVTKHRLYLSQLKSTPFNQEDTVQTTGSGTRSRLKQKKSDSRYIYHAFIDELNDKDFTGVFARVEDKFSTGSRGKRGGEEEEDEDNRIVVNANASTRRTVNVSKVAGHTIPSYKAENILLFDPSHYYLNFKSSGTPIQYEQSERAKEKLAGELQGISSANRLESSILNRSFGPGFDAGKLNDLSLLSDFMEDVTFNYQKNVPLLPLESTRLSTISDRLQTRHMAVVEVFSVTFPRETSISTYLTWFILFPPIVVIPLVQTFIPVRYMAFSFKLFDLMSEDSPLLYFDDHTVRSGFRTDMMRHSLYYLMNQAKTNE
jgi:beta-barrel assembly-enhancing protease